MVLLCSDLSFKFLDVVRQFNVSSSFIIDSLLKIGILISVFLFKRFEMVELVLEADNLILELDDFAFTVDKLSLLVLEVKGLCVNQFVQVIDSSELL